jgi:hypothetical protein
MRCLKIVPAALLTVVAGVAAASAQEPREKPGMTATLVDPDQKAARGEATVTVKVTGLTLTDPSAAGEKPKPGQGHLHYQVDDGPVVATTTPKLSFHGLKPGAHKVVVMLAGNDHAPLGPQQTLNVTVP